MNIFTSGPKTGGLKFMSMLRDIAAFGAFLSFFVMVVLVTSGLDAWV